MVITIFEKTSICRAERFRLQHFVWVFTVFLLAFFLHPLAIWAAAAKVEAIHSQDRYPAGNSYPISFRIHISSPWYIHGARDTGHGIIPTRLSFAELPDLKIADIQFPTPEKKSFDYAKQPLEVFSGKILVRGSLAVSDNARSGERIVEGQLSYQACSNNACLPPEKLAIRIPILIAPEGTTAKLQNREIFKSAPSSSELPEGMPGWKRGDGLWLMLVGVFLGGLALNLTPCIYPLIPITISYFGGRRRKKRGRIFIDGILYISGLAFTNSILGLTASLSGGMLGSILQEPIVLLVVAGILVVLALSFFGFWELRLPSGLTNLASKNFSGYFGTFFMGLTLGVLAAPCLGPFILGLLTYVGQKGDPFLGFLFFFVLSIGLGLPLMVLALFSSTLEKLPMSGQWMVWIRKALGWVLVGMAGYFLKPLVPTAMGEGTMLAAVLVAAGFHLGWLEKSSGTGRVFPYFRKALGVILIGSSIIFFLAASHSRDGIVWTPYSPAIVAEAAKRQKPVILDFYADWCGPCVALDKNVFNDPEVVKLSQNLVTIRVNLTQQHALQDEILRRYQIKGVPTIIFINKQGSEERTMRIESYVGRQKILKKMKQLIESS